jgi:hypothetical protein
VITGRVVDEFGDPASDVAVIAQQFQWVGGRRRLVPGPQARTDDIGQFRLFGLMQGDYVVSATFRDQMWMGTSEDRVGYAATYFPGTPVASEAQSIAVRPGQEMSIGD